MNFDIFLSKEYNKVVYDSGDGNKAFQVRPKVKYVLKWSMS